MALRTKSGLIVVGVVALCGISLCAGQSAPQTSQPSTSPSLAEPSSTQTSFTQPSGTNATPGHVNGTIVDQSGAIVIGAKVRIIGENAAVKRDAITGDDGQFSFSNIAPGNFKLTIDSAGFASQIFSGSLEPGQIETVGPIMLAVATDVTEVRVGLTQVEVAEQEMKVEEQQRVLGAIPNFYVTYVHDPAPLTSKQKYKLALKTVIDPVTFLMVAGSAGVQQWQNHFEEYGQGAQGYAKRFAAGYGDTLSGTFIGGAILPALLKQDPRYFYKGTGSVPARFMYAVANSVICKGDNKRWQPSYSNILGSLAAGGISNLYYPGNDRNGAELTFENAAVGIGASAATNLLQEFLIKKLTPKAK